MPNFCTNAGEEVYVGAARPVFRRGERLDDATIRRIRDIWIEVLCSLGMDSSDVARTLASSGVTDRQVRNKAQRNMRLDYRKALEDMAVEIIASAQTRVAMRPPPRPRPRKRPAEPRRSRQLLLPFNEE